MHKVKYLLSLAIIFLSLFSNSNSQTISSENSLYMFGSIESNKMMTGFYSKNSNTSYNQNWFVFVGQNGKVYKIAFVNKNIGSLYVDGQKIADDEISKYETEYKPFLTKFWRNLELEAESEKIDLKVELIDKKTETLEKEIEKLDKTEEKLDKIADKGTDVSFDIKSIDSQRRRLEAIQNDYEKDLETFSNQQENISHEVESLNLVGELDKVLDKIIADLKTLGLVKNANNNSFKFSNFELIVNGKKIQNEVYEQLKAKYIVEFTSESGFLYHWKSNV